MLLCLLLEHKMTVFVLKHHSRSRWQPQLLQTHGRVDKFLYFKPQMLNNNHGGRIQAVKGTRHSVFSTAYWTYNDNKTKARVTEWSSTINSKSFCVGFCESMMHLLIFLLTFSELQKSQTRYSDAKINDKLRWTKTFDLCRVITERVTSTSGATIICIHFT